MRIKGVKSLSNEETVLSFVLWPFGAFLYSILNLKRKFSFIIVFLFFILFGYTFLPENEKADSYRYAIEFNEIRSYSADDYLNDLDEYLTFESNNKDIYVLTCSFLVLSVKGNYHLLMTLYAFVFGFFYLKSLRFFVKRDEYTYEAINLLLLFLFTFSNPIFNINGVRFWTAAWIIVYSFFQVIVNRNFIYLLLMLLTPLIHVSYITIIGVILIYLLFRKMEKTWMVLFVVSFFLSRVAFDLIISNNEILPPVFQNMIWSYTNDGLLSDKEEIINNLPLYAKVLNSLPGYFINVLIFVFIYNRKKLEEISNAYPVYIFLLIWMTFVNLTWAIPSFGLRFFYLALPFVAYLMLITYREIPLLRKLTYFIPVVFSYSVLDWLKNMISISDPFLYCSTLLHIVLKNF